MIEVNNVSFIYKNEVEKQISNITFNVSKGNLILLCGKSGCGKSTVAKLLNGLIPNFVEGDFSGKVKIKGRETKQIEMYELAETVGSVFQNPKTQFFNLDTDGELYFGLENKGEELSTASRRVNGVIEELSIKDLLNRKVFELSGGEKQVLAIASVYATNPDIYVFDEPSANIDKIGITKIRNILQHIKSQGKTVIIAEHRLYYIMDLIDKAVYLEDGKINKIYLGDEFRNIDDKQRKEMGLRSFEATLSNDLVTDFEYCQKDELLIKDLSYCKRDNFILKGINLSANKGDIIGITGSNGVGKSTLGKCICGLLKESGGGILYKGKKVTYKKRLEICYMVMQDVVHQLFANSVIEEFNIIDKKISTNTITDVLEEVNLSEYKNKHPLCLSGGQMQRLAVATGIFSNKDIMIFDEPTSGLDYANMIEISNLIKKISDNKIIFIITQDDEFLSHCCTKKINLDLP